MRGGSPSGCGEPGVYELVSLAAGFRAQNALEWKWVTAPDVSGDDLLHYTMVLGTNGDQVEACACELANGRLCTESGDLRVIDETRNPELAHDTLSNQTGEANPSRKTVTDSLDSDTVYQAVLLAFDTEGGVSRTALAQHRTGRSTSSALVLFDRGRINPTDEPRAYTVPGCLSDVAGAGYEIRAMCPPSEVPIIDGSEFCALRIEHPSRCWVTLRWQDFGLLADPISEGAFGDAHVEFTATLAGAHSNYGEFYLTVRSREGVDRIWGYVGGVSLRGEGMTRTYQIPLSALVLTSDDGAAPPTVDQALTHEDLNPNGQPATLYRFAIGGIFDHNSPVQIHSLKLRY